MSDEKDHIQFQFDELNRINSAIGTLRGLGIGPLDSAFQALERAQGVALRKIGVAQPRTSTFLKLLTGLSPGSISLFLDAERGWLVEGIIEPGAEPVYKYVGDGIASRILLEDLTPEIKEFLWTPESDFIA